jgi:hypothetical protein
VLVQWSLNLGNNTTVLVQCTEERDGQQLKKFNVKI